MRHSRGKMRAAGLQLSLNRSDYITSAKLCASADIEDMIVIRLFNSSTVLILVFKKALYDRADLGYILRLNRTPDHASKLNADR